MVDSLSKEKRTWNMRRIRSVNTKPEHLVRSLLHGMGLRFRLHGKVSKKYVPNKLLPGKPDIVLVKYKTVIFVHGCFWHKHDGCKRSNIPKSNTDYWRKKLERNVQRDKENEQKLHELDWRVIKIWECELKDMNKLKKKIESILY